MSDRNRGFQSLAECVVGFQRQFGKNVLISMRPTVEGS